MNRKKLCFEIEKLMKYYKRRRECPDLDYVDISVMKKKVERVRRVLRNNS